MKTQHCWQCFALWNSVNYRGKLVWSHQSISRKMSTFSAQLPWRFFFHVFFPTTLQLRWPPLHESMRHQIKEESTTFSSKSSREGRPLFWNKKKRKINSVSAEVNTISHEIRFIISTPQRNTQPTTHLLPYLNLNDLNCRIVDCRPGHVRQVVFLGRTLAQCLPLLYFFPTTSKRPLTRTGGSRHVRFRWPDRL